MPDHPALIANFRALMNLRRCAGFTFRFLCLSIDFGNFAPQLGQLNPPLECELRRELPPPLFFLRVLAALTAAACR